MSQTNSTPTIYVGIDVAKDSLAVHCQGQIQAFTQETKSLAKLVRLLQKFPHVHVVLEATGGYEQPLVQALHAAKIALSVMEPARVRHFAKAQGRRAKTDPIDATVLTAFGAAVQPPVTPAPTAAERQLAEWVQRRRQLVDSVTTESNRAAHYTDALARRQAAAHLTLLRAQIKECQQAIERLVAQTEKLQWKAQRYQQVSGVAEVTSSILLADMPELGTLSPEGAAALAGVAPYNCDSGPRQGTRRVSGGRATVRCALYMAALSAIRYEPVLRAFYQGLLGRGKSKMVALTAVMRKLIVLLNHMVKHPEFELQHAKKVNTPEPAVAASAA